MVEDYQLTGARDVLPWGALLREARDEAAWRRVTVRMGRLPLAVAQDAPRLEAVPGERAFGASGRVRAAGARLELGGLAFQRVACGLPALLRWVVAHGVQEVQLGVARRDRASAGE